MATEKMAKRRSIEPEMQLLWARLETVCATFDQLVTALVGSRRGFTLMVHPLDDDHATVSITNMPENVEAVREWISHMDESNAEREPIDDEQLDANLAAIKRGYEAVQAERADGWRGSVLLKARYREEQHQMTDGDPAAVKESSAEPEEIDQERVAANLEDMPDDGFGPGQGC